MSKKIIFSDYEINNIINEHVINNVNCKVIGTQYNVSEYTIRKLLKANNVLIIKRQFRRKYHVNENFLDDINDINSYFIGLMASDGNVKKNLKCFTISQSGDNGLKLMKKICEWLEYDGIIYQTKTTNKISYSVTITSSKLINMLISHNISPQKSSTYFYNKVANLKAFLQGYIDGDGCVGIYEKNKIKYIYISFFGNQFFKDSIIDLLPTKPTQYKNNNGYFELKFFGRKAISFCEWLWENPVYLEGIKFGKFYEFKNSYINTKHQKYHDLNLKIIDMLKFNIPIKEISLNLNINKRTIYNLKHNIKNGRGTF